ncbi:hypothetical protein K523DRAFT_225059, partial [Schizophyllum commune Tattone D]
TAGTMKLSLSERCAPGCWVLTKPRRGTAKPGIARVLEIIQAQGSNARIRGLADYVSIEDYRIGDVHPFYEMPRVYSTSIVRADILGMACVAHNCKDNKCSLTSVCTVRQEAELSKQQRKRVAHRNTDDLVLNIGQMRSSRDLSKYYPSIPPTDRESIIHSSAEKLYNKRK